MLTTMTPRSNQCRGLEITEVQIRLADPGSNRDFLGHANIVLNNGLAIRGLRLIQPEPNRRFIATPDRTRVDASGEKRHYDVAFPIRGDVRAWLERVVYDAYDRAAMAREEVAA